MEDTRVPLSEPQDSSSLELQIAGLESKRSKNRKDNRVLVPLFGTVGLVGLFFYLHYENAPVTNLLYLYTSGSVAILGIVLAVVVFGGGLITDAEFQSQIDLLNAHKRIASRLFQGLPAETQEGGTSYFDKLVGINIENLATYYSLVRNHTDKSFIVSVLAGCVGFVLIAIGLVFGFKSPNGTAVALPYLSTGSGVLTEFIAAVFFYLYNRTVRQMKEYHDSLIAVQNVLLAFKIVGDIKNEGDRAKMVSEMLSYLIGRQARQPFVSTTSTTNQDVPSA